MEQSIWHTSSLTGTFPDFIEAYDRPHFPLPFSVKYPRNIWTLKRLSAVNDSRNRADQFNDAAFVGFIQFRRKTYRAIVNVLPAQLRNFPFAPAAIVPKPHKVFQIFWKMQQYALKPGMIKEALPSVVLSHYCERAMVHPMRCRFCGVVGVNCMHR